MADPRVIRPVARGDHAQWLPLRECLYDTIGNSRASSSTARPPERLFEQNNQ